MVDKLSKDLMLKDKDGVPFGDALLRGKSLAEQIEYRNAVINVDPVQLNTNQPMYNAVGNTELPMTKEELEKKTRY